MARRNTRYRRDWHTPSDEKLVELRDTARQQADFFQSKGARLQPNAAMLDKLLRSRASAKPVGQAGK